jgi:hypothetical protein
MICQCDIHYHDIVGKNFAIHIFPRMKCSLTGFKFIFQKQNCECIGNASGHDWNDAVVWFGVLLLWSNGNDMEYFEVKILTRLSCSRRELLVSIVSR